MSIFKLYLLLYFFPFLNGSQGVLAFIAFLFFGLGVACWWGYCFCREALANNRGNKKDTIKEARFYKKYKSISFKASILFTILAIVCAFIPDKKTIFQIYGFHYITTNPQVAQIEKLGMAVVNNKLNELTAK